MHQARFEQAPHWPQRLHEAYLPRGLEPPIGVFPHIFSEAPPMLVPIAPGIVVRSMSSYAVLWTDSTDPHELWAGSLTLTEDGVHLSGGNGYSLVVHDLKGSDVEAVRRAGMLERVAGYPSLHLQTRQRRSFTIASLIGVGVVTEVLDAIAAFLTLG